MNRKGRCRFGYGLVHAEIFVGPLHGDFSRVDHIELDNIALAVAVVADAQIEVWTETVAVLRQRPPIRDGAALRQDIAHVDAVAVWNAECVFFPAVRACQGQGTGPEFEWKRGGFHAVNCASEICNTASPNVYGPSDEGMMITMRLCAA